MSSARDALLALGLDPDEYAKHEEEVGKRPRRDPRVCICGHPLSRHEFISATGQYMCTPAKVTCSCTFNVPVLTAQDTRLFLRKTTGPGKEHALMRGISASLLAGKDIEWIDKPQCGACGTSDAAKRIEVAPFNGSNRIVYDQNGGDSAYFAMQIKRNAFICSECSEGMR